MGHLDGFPELQPADRLREPCWAKLMQWKTLDLGRYDVVCCEVDVTVLIAPGLSLGHQIA